ncbi:MAG: cation-translocating P-type ATPase [Clostridiales bacterium]|jgi:cation-transporting ATPase E|nr:cation-translocating P-type ATPase [Clostridiales bacterium]
MKQETQNDGIRFQPDHQEGLTAQQVASRIREGLVNYETDIPTKSIGRIVRDNVCTLFNLINAVLAVAVILVGSYKNLLFMGVVLCNMVIGIVQEIRAKRTIDQLSILSSSKVKVVRDGKVEEVGIYDVVLDDVMDLSHGNQVSADCILLYGECDVNESMVTGESDAIHKKPGDMILSGSYLVSGHCRARTEHIGEDNYVSHISKQAKYLKKVQSEIMASLQKIIKIVSIMIIPIGILLFWNQMRLEDNTLTQAVVNTVAALIGMIPEGLVLLTSTVLAVSVIRLSRRKVLVQELYCIEALARVDVLCLDKTGTITEGRMELREVIPYGDHTMEQVEQALQALISVMEDESPTFEAIRKQYGRQSDWTVEQIVPFSSEKKWSGAQFFQKGSFVLGAPEFVLKGKINPIRERLNQYARENRVLILAHSNASFEGRELPPDPEILAFLLIQDVIRPEAEETLQFFADQGVDLKVISGDNPLTVVNIARRAGLPGAERYIDASTLETEEDIKQAVKRYSVFGRVTPMQKKQMVLALKEQGHTVAMTGDGVNDVLALKEADCSVAMASGSDAARNVSQLVLLDSSFASMPLVVAEGRRSINNIQRSASLFLVKTIYSFILALIFLFVHLPYPFVPIQLTLISALTIGIPSFVLALEPNKDRIRGSFFKNVISKSLPGAITIIFNVVAVMALSLLLDIPVECTSSMCVILTGFTGLLLVYKLCTPFNLIRRLLFGSISGGLLLGILVFHELFSLVPLSIPLLFWLGGLLAAAFFLFQLLLRVLDRRLIQKQPQK